VDALKARSNGRNRSSAGSMNCPRSTFAAISPPPYRCIGGAVFTMQRAGYARVGFISEPTPKGMQ
jgi:biopolymer transport protein ExbD